ncbi:4Fe-4S dicluster domain-containing protein [Chloroflexota bacterium]
MSEKQHTNNSPETKGRGWGKENYPFPAGVAFIECDEMKCTGCEICQMACSMRHHGIINKDLARIQVGKYLLPVSKGIQVTCSQCQDEERECEKACPIDPPAVYYNKELLHMVLDQERCLGADCMLCRDACPAKAIRNHKTLSPKPFVCDLCDIHNSGKRNPQCVNVCPTQALYYKDLNDRGTPIRDMMRKPGNKKAKLIARRLYPLSRDIMWQPLGKGEK